MKTLFPIDAEAANAVSIPGLRLIAGYITEPQERELIAAIDAEVWDTSWKRRRQLYGKSYGRQDAPIRPIPAWGYALIERMQRDAIGDRPFDQMLVNEYFPGQGISMHRDYVHFDRTVVSLSLAASCVMDFLHPQTGRRESLLLPRRSLLVLSDEARYQWQHGIAPRKNDRWQGAVIPRSRRLSVTFRLAKQNEGGQPRRRSWGAASPTPIIGR